MRGFQVVPRALGRPVLLVVVAPVGWRAKPTFLFIPTESGRWRWWPTPVPIASGLMLAGAYQPFGEPWRVAPAALTTGQLRYQLRRERQARIIFDRNQPTRNPA